MDLCLCSSSQAGTASQCAACDPLRFLQLYVGVIHAAEMLPGANRPAARLIKPATEKLPSKLVKT